MKRLVALALSVIVLMVGARWVAVPPVAAQGGTWFTPELVELPHSFSNPVFITHANDGSGRLFVVEQGGTIRIIANDALLPTPFLNISALITEQGSEQGLLSVAFSPDYATNGEFYVNYTERNTGGDTYIVRYTVSGENPNVANPNSAEVVLTIEQPYDNHNGGQLQFGQDGMLYIGMGDGGSGGDPQNYAQRTDQLLGKMLRIDVEGEGQQTYTIPADNPFVGNDDYRPEIWQLGLRNPWRFSFDRQTGDMYIADVGQGEWEEVNFQPAASDGGENWGWRCYEGTYEYDLSECEPDDPYEEPVTEYSHDNGCSITGGYVYRGTSYPIMNGVYFYSDYCSGNLWGLRNNNGWESQILADMGFGITGFGEGENGELYVVNGSSGRISMLTTADSPTYSDSIFLPLLRKQ